MFIHGNFSMPPIDHAVKAQGIKPNAVKQTALQTGPAALRPARDRVSLSPYGKANSALSGLEKLRQQIEDRRDQFLSKATEEGQSAEVIQAQLDSFDQQLKDIDKQMVQMTIQQANQNIEKGKHAPSTQIKRPKTRQEVENQRLANITNLSTGLDQAEAIDAVKTQVDGDIGVKKSEIELEKGRGGDAETLEAELSALQSRSNQLTAGINGQLQETLEKIQESNDQAASADVVDSDKTDGKEREEEASAKVEAKAYPANPDVAGKESDAGLQAAEVEAAGNEVLA